MTAPHPLGRRDGRADAAHPAGPVLGLDGLGWSVGGATILQDITLDVREGEFLAFIGPNGAGKTSCSTSSAGWSCRPAARSRWTAPI